MINVIFRSKSGLKREILIANQYYTLATMSHPEDKIKRSEQMFKKLQPLS